jgi:hypothetical protein
MFLVKWQLRRNNPERAASIELGYAKARRYHHTPPDTPSQPLKPGKDRKPKVASDSLRLSRNRTPKHCLKSQTTRRAEPCSSARSG